MNIIFKLSRFKTSLSGLRINHTPKCVRKIFPSLGEKSMSELWRMEIVCDSVCLGNSYPVKTLILFAVWTTWDYNHRRYLWFHLLRALQVQWDNLRYLGAIPCSIWDGETKIYKITSSNVINICCWAADFVNIFIEKRSLRSLKECKSLNVHL